MQSGDILLNDKTIDGFQTELNEDDIVSIKLDWGTKQYPIWIPTKVKSELIAFHKPLGYVVSKSDPHNQTIYELLPKELQNYDYIWRLDKDSTGLLLLTNDKKLVHELSHPSFGLIKTYLVRIDIPLHEDEIDMVKKGIRVQITDNREQVTDIVRRDEAMPHPKNSQESREALMARPANDQNSDYLKFESVSQEEKRWYIELTIELVEGHKRHIKRLLKAIGKKVYAIHRIKFGSYELGDLEIEEFRNLGIKN